MKRTCLKGRTAMLLLAGFLAAQPPAMATPVLSSTIALKSAALSDLVEVRWRDNRGGAVAAGVAAGLLFGAIAGSSARYYGPPPYYGPGYYAPPYDGPVYLRPAPVYGPSDWLAYCFSRYQSFDPVTGTYMG